MNDENKLVWTLAPIGIARVSRGGRFLAVNQGYCEITGYAETELLARTFQQITHPDDLESDTNEANNLANRPDVDSYQMVKRYIRKDGRTVWVSLYAHAVRNKDGDFEQYLVFAIELVHLGIYSGDQVIAPQRKADLSFFEILKQKPKEFITVATVIAALARGEDIIGILRQLFLINK